MFSCNQTDIVKTQHFTSNYGIILKGIVFHPESAIDPFAGDCDLRNYSPNTKWSFYDLDPKHPYIKQNDSLLNPPDYKGKNVITNPPYLAKNKTKEFGEIFSKYHTDDLYKAAVISLVRGGCEKGILIIPVNFFTDEFTNDVRCMFLNNYYVDYVNYFDEQVFENTTYNICAFYFEKRLGGTNGLVRFFNPIQNKGVEINIKPEFGYRVGGEFYSELSTIQPIFTRAVDGGSNEYLTRIYLEALDTREVPLHLEIRDEPYLGASSDRIRATLVCERDISLKVQSKLVDAFNGFMKDKRAEYGNLILTNYRDFGRKRISFDDVYKICTMLLQKIEEEV